MADRPTHMKTDDNTQSSASNFAQCNRELFQAKDVTCINLISSPGSGKTTLFAQTLRELDGRLRCVVIEGDLATDRDLQRLHESGAQVVALPDPNYLNPDSYLDATALAQTLSTLDLDTFDLVLVENMINLSAPAVPDIGEQARAMIFSPTQGEDNPLKYPTLFQAVDVVVVNKIDLLPHLDFEMNLFLRNLRTVNQDVRVIECSAKSGHGVSEWVHWIGAQAKLEVPFLTE